MIKLIQTGVCSGVDVFSDRNNDVAFYCSEIVQLKSASRNYLERKLNDSYGGWHLRKALRNVLDLCKVCDVETSIAPPLTKKKILDNREEICRIIEAVRAA